ncbi:hypothetical protein [uncultured Dokdonia sp.]|uniref:hypothetical protein n=1 Tax=uncultured Dokdonia sp. TaxID=575653 RepID=UPI002627200E|nr:hypothetical protein [uncultured Dokdonia sp.]
MFKSARSLISFIDLLACALGASILLMLVFAKSKELNNQAEGFGSPKDFIYCEIELNDANAYLLLQIRPKGGEWRKFRLNAEGKFIYENDFILLSNNQLEKPTSFYAWGPYYKKNNNTYNTDSQFLGIYGVDGKDQKDWEFSASYISSGSLNWKEDTDPNKINKVKGLPPIELVYKIRNKNSVSYTERKITLGFGETKVFNISIEEDEI